MDNLQWKGYTSIVYIICKGYGMYEGCFLTGLQRGYGNGEMESVGFFLVSGDPLYVFTGLDPEGTCAQNT